MLAEPVTRHFPFLLTCAFQAAIVKMRLWDIFDNKLDGSHYCFVVQAGGEPERHVVIPANTPAQVTTFPSQTTISATISA
jgi:hypothetical protein